ncbi:acetyltransferase [Mycobacterium sp. Marseille-P9652]|uniref:acetyltransferase n=1 Tax=Mycobacterium sp. Marseille-P9652 TaxID=2654950 RepID=UPI0012E90CDF|nr:acetyltransferase [Mycobacterium sp. Marseille-P9652]
MSRTDSSAIRRWLFIREGCNLTQKLIFLGAGGIATVAFDIAIAHGFEVAGFLDDDPARHGTTFRGKTILGGVDLLPELKKQGLALASVAFGNCAGRLKSAALVRSLGFEMPNLVHPSAVIAPNAELGPGAIVMPGAIVSTGAKVGANVILNTACSVDHDCRVAEGAHIAPGVHISGRVTIGRAAWVGPGAVVLEDVNIGADALVGASSLVLKDIPDGVVAYGTPARVIRPNTPAG